MTKIEYAGEHYSCREGETVLEVFMRHGVTVPFSCEHGICHVCLQLCDSGKVPEHAQQGLSQALQSKGYFLPCKCVPEEDMKIVPPVEADRFTEALVHKKEFLTPDICRLLLEPLSELYYHAGQFINIRGEEGETRSYSLASVPHLDYFMEIHVKRVDNGLLSHWIFDKLQENDLLQFHGPTGNCFYVPGEKDQSILLVCTGTGLSPLLGIVHEALDSGHTGPIYLYHGSHHAQGIYRQELMTQIAHEHPNFHPVFCVSGDNVDSLFRASRADDAAFSDHSDLSQWRIYLCGQADMVDNAKQSALQAGANRQNIHIDPPWRSPNGSKVNNINNTEIVQIEQAEYPEPDLELWSALDEGKLLAKVLIDFYDRVYEDPLLFPFFDGITKQRLIEKQYNFMYQVLTGQKVYFGERPRNAHHWMVISDELMDHREALMESCLRRGGLPEKFVQRLRAIEEIYRPEIVKDQPWKKILFGKEMPVEGFEEMTLDDATLCDSCQKEIAAGEWVRYHLRLGTVYCGNCRKSCDD
ncbi:hypothetical protein MNBD_GAMMA12-1283 [hydrothermal vent metagenome]|uniref:2-polyprenylphenol hydroxylase and related flavodoxin oxidoreductases / CDP-6-deoxy-delta-3,4-glucoseen reductase-like n=1 Tax=hydrothermal vent metagenome TaxID=652676 RepID=A0A3B0Y2M2_9ZZZZ